MPPPEKCARRSTYFNRKRYAFQGAANDVFVYGSKAAEQAGGDVVGQLPRAVFYSDGSAATFDFDFDSFGKTYFAFLTLTKREVTGP